MSQYRCPLSKMQPNNPANETELDELREKMWHRQGYLLLRPEDCKDEWERLFFYNKGNELYGRRK